jgi:hypothetical protein
MGNPVISSNSFDGYPFMHSISLEEYPATESLYPPPIPSLAHGCARGLLHSDGLNDLSFGIPRIELEPPFQKSFEKTNWGNERGEQLP